MGNPPAAAGAHTTRLDPVMRSRARVLVSALPFAIIAAIGVSGMVSRPGGACCRCWPWAQLGGSGRRAALHLAAGAAAWRYGCCSLLACSLTPLTA
jgi:hypothetical protein